MANFLRCAFLDDLCGGIILVAMGWAMLMERDEGCDTAERKRIHPQDVVHQAFYPLTLPRTVGPGSISVAITLGANAARSHGLHPLMILAALVGSALIALSIFLCYGFANRLARVLGEDGDVRDDKTLVISFSLYRCSDRLERYRSSARVRGAARRSVGHQDASSKSPAGHFSADKAFQSLSRFSPATVTWE